MDAEKIKRAAEINAKRVEEISQAEYAEFGEIWNALVDEAGAVEAHTIISKATKELESK